MHLSQPARALAPFLLLLSLAPRPAAQEAELAQLRERFESWRGARTEWRMLVEPRSGFASFVHGGRARPRTPPREEADLFRVARDFVEETAGFTGLEPETLIEERVHLLPLAQIGSTDKWAVRFAQRWAGVPVVDGSVNVLLDREGRLLALQSNALTGLRGRAGAPAIAPEAARARALEHFAARTGLAGSASEARLVFTRRELAGRWHPALAFEVRVQWRAQGYEPEGEHLWLDARDGTLLRRAPSVHHLDVGGTLRSNATSGMAPDGAANPPVPRPVPYTRVSSSAGTVYTDANGDFLFPGASGPLMVTTLFVGEFARVFNLAGPPYVLSETINGTGNVLLMNPAPTELTTAQANAFIEIAHLRDWIRSVDPGDDTADFQAIAEVNLQAGCNAYFDGDSVVFHRENTSLGCPNTAYSSIVAHEMGHWLNERYLTRNVIDGMGEGNADVFAMYAYDTPVVAEGFFGPGTVLRTGLNTRQFCGDCCSGCHGPIPHDNGEVWMGAAWKVRARLQASLGRTAGALAADTLFLAWMNGFDQLELKSVIEAQWLVLDDDDGDLSNGSPHFAQIDGGFREQGFPGVQLDPIAFRAVTALPDTLDELGPYTVQASIVAVAAPPLLGAELHWRVDGGAWQVVPMSALGADLYAADIPGQGAVSKVEYHLRATDSQGALLTWPSGAPESSLRFHVGMFELFFDDFEGGTNGWTQGSFQDTPNWFDDFHHGIPYGKSGDPAAAYSGRLVRGNNLGAGNFNGRYQSNQHAWLRSPAIDCTNATGTRLRLRRWLSVEAASADQARIRVDGTTIFQNAPHVALEDQSWVFLDYDVSALADGKSSVVIEFSIQSNPTLQLGGWTIDDVQLVSMGPSGCLAPASYGSPKTNSLGLEPRLTWTGSPSALAQDLVLHAQQAVPNEPCVLYRGSAPDATPFHGGLRLIGNRVVRERSSVLDGAGAISIPIAVTSAMRGESRYYQLWYRDGAHPDGSGVGLTDAVVVLFCD